MSILVTGAEGTVGRVVVRELAAAGARVRRAGRRMSTDESAGRVRFDFTDPDSWDDAFRGVHSMFLVRPPALGNVRRDMFPALTAAREAGVGHVVFLSIQGADHLRVLPHAVVESWLRDSGMEWTFVRPSFFHQNLSTTHVEDIRDRDEIAVPAGHGRTAFVDAADVGAVGAIALLDPTTHGGRAWTITGPEALTYEEFADILSRELEREITYTNPGLPRYVRHARRRLDMPWAMAAVTAGIYTTARLGMAAELSDDVRTVLGREPIDFAAFAHRCRDVWHPAAADGRA